MRLNKHYVFGDNLDHEPNPETPNLGLLECDLVPEIFRKYFYLTIVNVAASEAQKSAT